jgi:hypothetical protein
MKCILLFYVDGSDTRGTSMNEMHSTVSMPELSIFLCCRQQNMNMNNARTALLVFRGIVYLVKYKVSCQ